MKKLIILLFICVTASLHAQNWSFAPKIGLNLANMTNMEGSMKPGLNLGVTAEYRFNDVFAIEPGLFYSMQGSKGSDDGISIKLKNDYLNIPVFAKAYVKDGFNVFAGPQLGFKVSEKIKESEKGMSASVDTDFFKTIDFSLVLGVGYQFDMGFLISANYNIGLNNITKKEAKVEDLLVPSSHNGVLQLTLGWRF